MTLNNVAGKVFEVGGTLGIKGFLSLGCLAVGIAGLTVGVKSSYKIDSMVEAFKKIENAEMDDDIKSLVQDHIIGQAERYERSIAELQSYIKDIETDSIESISKELNIINKKIDAFNLTTVIEKWSDAHLSEQADENEKTAGQGIRELINFVRETQTNYQDVEQKFNSIKGDINRKLDSFLQDIEDIKNKQTEILEEIQNNQSELIDINEQTFDILEILKNKKRGNVKNTEVVSNLIDIEINSKTSSTISGFNNAVEIDTEFADNSKVDTITGSIIDAHDEITENDSYHYVVETGEISREANQFSGFAYSTDVNYDSSSFELNYFSGSGEINGSLEGLTVEEDQ